MDKNKHPNDLVLYRKRRALPQKKVASLLGHRDSSMLSRYENGRSLPPLPTALRLEIIYRAPVAFLYYKLYKELREQVRQEEAIPAEVQPTLF